MGLFGPPDIPKLKARGDTAGLGKLLLNHPSPAIRREAADALGEVPDADAAFPLMKALKYDADPLVRGSAAVAVVGKAHRPVTEAVIAAMGDPDPHVRQRVAYAMSRSRGIDYLPSLRRALADPDASVRREVADALERTGFAPKDGDEEAALYAEIKGAAAAKATAALGGGVQETLRGGLGEPYCSQACYDSVGRYAASVLMQNQSGVCGFCRRTVQASMYGEPACGAIPYEGMTLFVCTGCTARSREHLADHPRCCVCLKPLS
jgi:hypothetical protein